MHLPYLTCGRSLQGVGARSPAAECTRVGAKVAGCSTGAPTKVKVARESEGEGGSAREELALEPSLRPLSLSERPSICKERSQWSSSSLIRVPLQSGAPPDESGGRCSCRLRGPLRIAPCQVCKYNPGTKSCSTNKAQQKKCYV